MILIECGDTRDRGFDAKLLFCAQLARRGHDAVIDAASLPEGANRNTRFEAAPYLRDLPDTAICGLILIGAEAISDEVLIRLRRIDLATDGFVVAVGRFADHQGRFSAGTKLAYVLGREPAIIDLGEAQPGPLVAAGMAPAAAMASVARRPNARLRVLLILPDAVMEAPATLPILMALDNLPDLRPTLILSGQAKEQLKSSRFASLRAFGIAELPPSGLVALSDIAVVFGAEVPGERAAALVTDLLASGGMAVDCTDNAVLSATSAPVLRGPPDLAALANYLRYTVLPNRAEITRSVAESPWIAARRIERIEDLLGLATPGKPEEPAREARTLFLPTNGAGLGHARRSTLIAREMAGHPVCFAAFPSCVPLVRAAGYDCLPLVSKSPFHPAEHANDLVNYMRLRRALGPGDRLVFDGGYVFDSIYRTIVEKDLDAVWVRRGLWQTDQITAAALDREAVFARVIVPSEAFEELNGDMSFGDHIRRVGPIVGTGAAVDRAAQRARLAKALGRPFDELVVTMLGGGVAADRTAQMQFLSALASRRKHCLHLVLIWPGSTVPPALYGWQNTVVCQTRNAIDIAAAADLVVTAAGYNSFHEVLYHGLPAIFMPQMAAFMDDQERRAEAAQRRGLAVTVAASDLLMLGREISACLDGGKAAEIRAALGEVALPERGNRRAAALIAEIGRP